MRAAEVRELEAVERETRLTAKSRRARAPRPVTRPGQMTTDWSKSVAAFFVPAIM